MNALLAWLVPALQIVAALWLADLGAALFHLVTDRGFNHRRIVAQFMNHHRRPATMTFDLEPVAAGLPIALVGLWLAPWFWVSLGIFVSFCQIPHYWTHHPAPRGVRWLQCCGVLLRPEKHASHHASFDRDFCVVNGWNNWLVNWLALKAWPERSK